MSVFSLVIYAMKCSNIVLIEITGEISKIHSDALTMQFLLGGGKHCVFGGSSDAQCWHECNL